MIDKMILESICDVEGRFYIGVSNVCKMIGLTKNQKDRQVKNVQVDSLLKQGCKMFDCGVFDDYNKTLGLDLNLLSIWLSSINRKSLNNSQYEIVINIINWCLSEDFNKYKIPTKIYEWEGELRDEIYECGFFGEYEIIDKEVVFSFGRIDLIAKDKNDELVVIELKKHKNYNDVIKQCKKYINGYKKEFNKDVKVIVCTLDDDSEFLTKARENNIDVYTYKRELKLKQLI